MNKPVVTGIEIFIEALVQAEVRYLFGNPGTTELPLNAALARDDRLRYRFALHETPVMAMADGYSLASGKLGVVNLHTACGLGNAMGMLYNAQQEGTPLLVTAGQQDQRLLLSEPVLAGDLVRMAQPLTKWSYEIHRLEDIGPAVRRAAQIALAPPRGPVFLSLPLDLQMATLPAESLENPERLQPFVIDRRQRPAVDLLRNAVELLEQAKRPVILAGSRVTESGAIDSLVALAERWGAPVYAESTPSHGRLPFRCEHPLYQGVLPYWANEIEATLNPFDTVLAVGLNLMRLYIHRQPEQPIPAHLKLIQLDSLASELGKNISPTVGLLGDPAATLSELLMLFNPAADFTAQATARLADYTRLHMERRRKLVDQCCEQLTRSPLTAQALMYALSQALPPNTAVVEEAITTHQNLFERLGVITDPSAFFAHRGWGLGWGIGCALGVKLAWPERPVLGLIGDGAAMFGLQGLWSAAHHNIGVTFVIPNNSQYKILKVCGQVLNLDDLQQPTCPGLNLSNPTVDYVKLAQGLGIHAERLESAAEVTERVGESLRSGHPRLFEVPISD
jgi:benzoylformate decarboxylase